MIYLHRERIIEKKVMKIYGYLGLMANLLCEKRNERSLLDTTKRRMCERHLSPLLRLLCLMSLSVGSGFCCFCECIFIILKLFARLVESSCLKIEKLRNSTF